MWQHTHSHHRVLGTKNMSSLLIYIFSDVMSPSLVLARLPQGSFSWVNLSQNCSAHSGPNAKPTHLSTVSLLLRPNTDPNPPVHHHHNPYPFVHYQLFILKEGFVSRVQRSSTSKSQRTNTMTKTTMFHTLLCSFPQNYIYPLRLNSTLRMNDYSHSQLHAHPRTCRYQMPGEFPPIQTNSLDRNQTKPFSKPLRSRLHSKTQNSSQVSSLQSQLNR